MDKDTIFSNGGWAVNVETVGELIKELQRLNPDTPVLDTVSGADVVLFNRDMAGEHVGFAEGGEWTEDSNE